MGCLSCHSLGGTGDIRAPALDGVAARYVEHMGSEEGAATFFRNHVSDPATYPGVQKSRFPELAMPKIAFSDEELDALVAFLMTQR